jgi:ferredoxin-type protein NapH
MNAHKIKHTVIELLRNSTQLLVVAIILALPCLSLYAHYYSAKATEDLKYLSVFPGKILLYLDQYMSTLQNPQPFLESFKGSLWSMRFAGFDISDPLAAAEMLFASKTIHVPFLISIILPIIITLLLGRVFCSWLCPAHLLFTCGNKLRSLLKFAEINPPKVVFSLNNKYVVLAVGLIAALLISQPIFSIIYPPAILSRISHALIYSTAFTGMAILILLIILVELFISPRWWCRTICPGGALYALLGWPRLLRIKVNPKTCNNCGKCVPVCDFGIDPVTESAGIECTNCGKCVRKCPQESLFYTVSLPEFTAVSKKSGSLVPLLFFFFMSFMSIFTFFPSVSFGHHILGLPHYSYKENYPQAPTLEYPATAGPFDILMTSYPGKPVPKESAAFSFYVKNGKTGEPYDKRIHVRVIQNFNFGRKKEILEPTICEPFERPHRLNITFPDNGEYIVEISFEVEGKTEIIQFLIIAGDPGSPITVLAVLLSLLIIFVIVIRAIKIKRARRSADLELTPDSTSASR